MELRNGHPPATETQIIRFEEMQGQKLPDDYRQFLKVSNGGLNGDVFFKERFSEDINDINAFFGLAPEEHERKRNLYRSIGSVYGLPKFIIPIGDNIDGCSLLLSLDEDDFGYIYYGHYQDEEEPYNEEGYKDLSSHVEGMRKAGFALIATSFTDLLSRTASEEEFNAALGIEDDDEAEYIDIKGIETEPAIGAIVIDLFFGARNDTFFDVVQAPVEVNLSDFVHELFEKEQHLQILPSETIVLCAKGEPKLLLDMQSFFRFCEASNNGVDALDILIAGVSTLDGKNPFPENMHPLKRTVLFLHKWYTEDFGFTDENTLKLLA